MKMNVVRYALAFVLLMGAIVAPSSVQSASSATSHTISFNANGGSGVMAAQRIPTKGKKLPASKFVRDSHRFIGWSLTRTGPVKYYSSSIVKPKNKMTLFAQWRATVSAPVINGYRIGKLLWSDSFTGNADGVINSSNWTTRYCGHEADNGGGTCHNAEKQWYMPEAVRLDGTPQGNVVITTKKVSVAPANSGSCMSPPCGFTSGRFDTQKKVSFKYGYIETRMQMPAGGGNWPAFWALGDSISNVGWPRSGEIDIAEQGGNLPTRNSAAVHFSNVDQAICCGNHRYVTGEERNVANYQAGFHTYGIAWLPNRMDFYVDRELFWSVTPSNVQGHWSFNEPFFLILNNAVNYNGFGGSYNGWQESKTLIDYVHAWQLDGQGQVIKR